MLVYKYRARFFNILQAFNIKSLTLYIDIHISTYHLFNYKQQALFFIFFNMKLN